MTTNQIDQEFDNINVIRNKMIQPVKVQLHTGMDGFDSPEAFAVYRKSGGKPLGVVGRVFEPPNLNHFLDSIVKVIFDNKGYYRALEAAIKESIKLIKINQ